MTDHSNQSCGVVYGVLQLRNGTHIVNAPQCIFRVYGLWYTRVHGTPVRVYGTQWYTHGQCTTVYICRVAQLSTEAIGEQQLCHDSSLPFWPAFMKWCLDVSQPLPASPPLCGCMNMLEDTHIWLCKRRAWMRDVGFGLRSCTMERKPTPQKVL